MELKMYHRHIISMDERIISRTHWKKDRSFVLQFLQHLDAMMNGAYNGARVAVSMLNTANAAKTLATGNVVVQTMSLLAPVATDTYGIVVGTGSGAVGNTDVKLGTQIAHGPAATQLMYGASAYTSAAVVGANVDMYFQRPFVNSSGGTITINEVGQYYSTYAGAAQNNFCISRDLSTQAVLNLQTDTVQFLWRTTA